MQSKVDEYDQVMLQPNFWESKDSQDVLKKRKRLMDTLAKFHSIETLATDADELSSMISEEDDEYEELLKEVNELNKLLSEMELESYLSGESDDSDAMMVIHSGAGGTEACDWTDMLFRMYTRFFERRGFDYKIVDVTPGDEAGLKAATITISGDYVYGYLRSEIGIHRLVRISPFDSNKRRHTSFASVFVYPQVDDDVEIEINNEDLRIDTYRASGAGGQHVNKTDSAVRITHIPTGIVVQSQAERSQHRNKDTAMKMLRSRLYAHEMEKQQEEKQKLESKKMKIEWGSQIRSYVLHPYKMVKDLRTGEKSGDTASVLDGDLDMFIKAYLEDNSNAE